MPKSRAEARRARKRRAEKPSGGDVWVERAWSFVTRPSVAGVLFVIIGIVCALVPTTSLPAEPSHGWWVAALRQADAVQGSVTLLVMAAFSGIAMLIAAYQARRTGEGGLLSLAAVATMATGVFVGLFVWFGAQSTLPVSRVAVPPGQTINSYPAIEAGRAFQVMLPVRLKLESVEPNFSKATVELRKAGEEEGVRNDIFVGDPLPVGDFRFSLVGLEMDPTVPTAILSAKEGISVKGARGSKVKFVPDGPEYEVKNIVRNFQGVMGPAVQLQVADGPVFWVFQRSNELEKPLSDIKIEKIETTPVAVFAVSKTNTNSLAAIPAILFALGFALLVLASDRREESIHELGLAREDA